MSEAVLFSFRNPELPPDGNLSGRMQLFEKIRGYDLEPLISLGAEAAYQGEEVVTHRLQEENATAPLAPVALAKVAVMVNRLNRQINKEALPRPDLLPLTINENATRALAHRKHRASAEVLEPLGIGIPTLLVESPKQARAFLEAYTADRFVVKPTGGTNGKGVQFVDRQRLPALLAEQPELLTAHILQPAYDFTHPFPAALRPYDAKSEEAFSGWNKSGIVKELRMYGFYSGQNTATFPVARAIQDGVDQWLFVDPESVPARLHERTAAAMAKAAAVSGAAAMFGTVDYGYGQSGAEQPEWHAIELNGKAPYMIGYDKHPHVADSLRNLFASQIAETVR